MKCHGPEEPLTNHLLILVEFLTKMSIVLTSCHFGTNIFSRYVPNNVFVELANKTNLYFVFKEGKPVQTNEEIRKLISLHLLMGVGKYPLCTYAGSHH